ncbi:MAG: YbaK/EbsC family protein [Clostridia bacterium]|nr:YbaK/EbsC family protein [Clostridia bacterium]
MSIEKGRAYFRQFGMEERVIEFEVSSATVELAAQALGVEGARIAKTLSFRMPEGCVLVVAAGDARIDNRKFKDFFHSKASMLSAEEVLELVGHPVGGVCPFGINDGVPVYLDESLKRFETVFPAVGSGQSAIELTLDELFEYSNASAWIEVCKLPE